MKALRLFMKDVNAESDSYRIITDRIQAKETEISDHYRELRGIASSRVFYSRSTGQSEREGRPPTRNVKSRISSKDHNIQGDDNDMVVTASRPKSGICMSARNTRREKSENANSNQSIMITHIAMNSSSHHFRPDLIIPSTSRPRTALEPRKDS